MDGKQNNNYYKQHDKQNTKHNSRNKHNSRSRQDGKQNIKHGKQHDKEHIKHNSPNKNSSPSKRTSEDFAIKNAILASKCQNLQESAAIKNADEDEAVWDQ